MRIWKNILTGVIICVLIVVGSALYFVSQFSAVYPPIKKYKYSGTIIQFENELKVLASSDSNFSYTNGHPTFENSSKGPSYYTIVNIMNAGKHNEYRIAYKETKDWLGNNRSEIYLIGAFDRVQKTGGYKIQTKGVRDLVELFEDDFIKKLGNNSIIGIK